MNDSLLTSPALTSAGFAHAFPCRDVTNEALAAALGVPDILRVNQVHGAHVAFAREGRAALAKTDADALVATTGEEAIGIRVADCVPVLVGDRGSGSVAAIHAGWRGIEANVISEALRAMTGRNDDRVAAIGPCIGACCFEVGTDVAARIAQAAGDPKLIVSTHAEGAKAMVDLRAAVRAQLTRAGIAVVEDVAGCTKCDPARRFFSYRRDGANAGRMLAVIRARP